MDQRLKKFLLVIGFLAVTLGLAFLIYWIFFRTIAVPGQTPTPTGLSRLFPNAGRAKPSNTGSVMQPPTTLPNAGESNIPVRRPNPTLPNPTALGVPSRTNILVTNAVQKISLATNGDSVRAYNPTDGKFYRYANDGSANPLSDASFYNVQDISWGHRSDEAIMTFPDGSKILYDFTKNKQTTLPKHWEDFQFSAQDDKIAAKSIGTDESNRFLITANPDGSNQKAIQELGNNEDKVHVDWSPNNNTVAFAFTGNEAGLDRQSVLLIGQNHENNPGLLVNGQGFVSTWSPTGHQLLYSVWDTSDGHYYPNLWISGADGDQINANRRNIQLHTWADKCAWASETLIYCGVPSNLQDGAGLQREAFDVGPDFIYRMDLRTGTATNLGTMDTNGAVAEMTISKDGKFAYINDKHSNALVQFNLE